MLVIAEFDQNADIIDIPSKIFEYLEYYQEAFWKWLFDKSVDHRYWIDRDGEKIGCCYRSDAFLEWLNCYPLSQSKEKAYLVQAYIEEYDKSLPTLFF